MLFLLKNKVSYIRRILFYIYIYLIIKLLHIYSESLILIGFSCFSAYTALGGNVAKPSQNLKKIMKILRYISANLKKYQKGIISYFNQKIKR
jgi:hypothetical protein